MIFRFDKERAIKDLLSHFPYGLTVDQMAKNLNCPPSNIRVYLPKNEEKFIVRMAGKSKIYKNKPMGSLTP